MIKKQVLSVALLVLSCLYYSSSTASIAISSTLGVKMAITNANCVVNAGKGISGSYNLPVISDNGRIVDRIGYTDVPLIIDCTKGAKISALNVSFSSPNPGFHDAINGLLKTTIADIGLQTRWRRNGGQVIDLSSATDMLVIKDTEVQPGIYDTSIKVYPVVLTSGATSLKPGRYHADLTVNITYF